MKKKIVSLRNYCIILCLLSLPVMLNAETDSGDYMTNVGKIYVVIAVIVVIFIGIFAFLFTIERRLNKLENQNPNNE
jgi:CcmD family protein